MRTRAAVLTLLVCGACCAGAAASSRSSSKISPSFVTKVNGLCATIDASFNRVLGPFPFPHFNPEHPDRKTLVLVGKHFAKALPIHRKIPGQLRKLGEPANGRAAWDAIRSLALQDNSVSIKQVSVALAGDTKAFVGTVHDLERLHARLFQEARAAGFAKNTPCSDAF